MFCSVSSVSLYRSMYCLCVNAYCTVLLPPGVNPIAVNKIYQYQKLSVSQHVQFKSSIAMARAALNKNKTLFTNKLELNLK